MLLRSAKTRSHDAEFGAIAKIIFAACAHSEQLLHRNFRATFGLSRPYRNFQKNFPESLVQANKPVLAGGAVTVGTYLVLVPGSA